MGAPDSEALQRQLALAQALRPSPAAPAPAPGQAELAAAQAARSQMLEQLAAAGGDLTPFVTQPQPLPPGAETYDQIVERVNREGWVDNTGRLQGGEGKLAGLRRSIARAAGLRSGGPGAAALRPRPPR